MKSPNTFERVQAIFFQAIEQHLPADWDRFLQEVCDGDEALRGEVRSLLDAHLEDNSFMSRPALGVADTLDERNRRLVGSMLGPYKLLQAIGEGGMGTVFMAEQTEPVHRRVAVKIIKAGMDSQRMLARFEAERQALALMDHPNIAKVFDAGTTGDGSPYFVMELVKGIPITQYCAERRLGLRERLELLADVCKAIQHAHQKGIIHRDIKPGNVLVTQYDGRPVPKVIDFGVAKAVGEKLTAKTLFTEFGALIGTLEYMSPEQAELNQLDIDTRSDIYSLGVLLYELLTGSTPVSKERARSAALAEMLRIIREEDPVAPSTRLSTDQGRISAAPVSGLDRAKLATLVRGELDWIVMKALDKDRARRYESCAAFAADIERYLNNEVVQAGPASLTYRLRKFARRHRAAAISIGVIALTITAASAFSTVKYLQERTARQVAISQTAAAQRDAKRADEQTAAANDQKREAVRQREEAERQRDRASQNLYYADARQCDAYIGAGELVRAQHKLLSYVPRKGGKDYRGWEWFYLLGRAHPAQKVLYDHGRAVADVVWSPDGTMLASVGQDGSLRIWDTITWEPIRVFADGQTIKTSVAWSFDGSRIAWGSASNESAIRIWHSKDGRIDTLMGHPGSVWAVAWSHDGRFIASGSIHTEAKLAPGNICIWDVRTLQSKAQFTTDWVRTVSWSPDDRILAISNRTSSAEVVLYDVKSETLIDNAIPKNSVRASWHPKEMLLAVGQGTGECLIWDHKLGAATAKWQGSRDEVQKIQWSEDGDLVLSAGTDGGVNIWSRRQQATVKSFTAHAGTANGIAIDPSLKRFASCGSDGAVRIWSFDEHRSPVLIDSGMTTSGGNIAYMDWSNDSRLLLVSGRSKVGAWNASTAAPLAEVNVEQAEYQKPASIAYVKQRLQSLEENPSESTTLTADVQQAIGGVSMLVGDASLASRSLMSPDGRRIAYIQFESRAYDVPKIREISSKQVLSAAPIASGTQALAWSPDSKLLAVAGSGSTREDGFTGVRGSVYVLDGNTGVELLRLLVGRMPRGNASAVAWSHDGNRIAAADPTGLCEIWDIKSRRRLVSEQIHSARVNAIAWTNDDSRIASGGNDEQIHIWDPDTGQPLVVLNQAGSKVQMIRWAPDNLQLASLGNDGVARIWSAAKGRALALDRDVSYLSDLQALKEVDRFAGEGLWVDAQDLLEAFVVEGDTKIAALHRLACVKLALRDELGYRNLCRRLLVSLHEGVGIKEVELVATACTLRAGAVENYEQLLGLMQRLCATKRNARTGRVLSRYSEALSAVLYRSGRFEEALPYLAAAERDAIPSPPASLLYLAAMTHFQLGHAILAKDYVERADKTAKTDLDGTLQPLDWTDRLNLLFIQQEARELFQSTEELAEPSSSERYQCLLFFFYSQRGDRANQLIQLQLIGGPRALLTAAQKYAGRTRAEACNEIAWFIVSAPGGSRDDIRDAVAIAKEAIELGPATPGVWNTLGVAEYRAGNWHPATAALTKSLSQSTDPIGEVLDNLYLAMCYEKLGDRERAKEHYERGVKLTEGEVTERTALVPEVEWALKEARQVLNISNDDQSPDSGQ